MFYDVLYPERLPRMQKVSGSIWTVQVAIGGYCPFKCKVFYGQELPSEESTTRECVVNYQLLAVLLLK